VKIIGSLAQDSTDAGKQPGEGSGFSGKDILWRRPAGRALGMGFWRLLAGALGPDFIARCAERVGDPVGALPSREVSRTSLP